MDTFTNDDLKLLAGTETPLCVSVFMPTHRGGQESRQDRIRLKDLLKDAEERLLALGTRSTAVADMLEPARDLMEDGLFWQNQSDGLAIFLSPGLFRYYRLPLSFEVLLTVSDRFQVRPVLPLLVNDGRFYLLALSQKQVKVFRGTRLSIKELDVASLPKGLSDALKYEDRAKEQHFQFHSALTAGGGGKPASVFHGHGVDIGDTKEDILMYLQQVDAGVSELLAGEHAPLVLAGVEYLLPIYREASTYKHLMDQGIEGNPDREHLEELHRRAWAIVEPYFRQTQQEAMAHFGDYAAAGNTSNDIRKVVPAAYYGRVEVLFVTTTSERWGTFEPDTGEIHLHRQQKAGYEDLLDMAAIQTILHGGTVYTVKPEDVPGRGPVAAVFRY